MGYIIRLTWKRKMATCSAIKLITLQLFEVVLHFDILEILSYILKTLNAI